MSALTERGSPVCGVAPLVAGERPRSLSAPAHLTERPDAPHPTDEGRWLEPYDGDTAAERDAWAYREDNWYWDADR